MVGQDIESYHLQSKQTRTDNPNNPKASITFRRTLSQKKYGRAHTQVCSLETTTSPWETQPRTDPPVIPELNLKDDQQRDTLNDRRNMEDHREQGSLVRDCDRLQTATARSRLMLMELQSV